MANPFAGLQQGADLAQGLISSAYMPAINREKLAQARLNTETQQLGLQQKGMELEGAQQQQQLNKALLMGAVAERALDIPEQMRNGYFSTAERMLGVQIPQEKRTPEALKQAASIKEMLKTMKTMSKPAQTVESAIVKDDNGNLYSARTTNRGTTEYSAITPGAPAQPVGAVSIVSKSTGMTSEESLIAAGKKAQITEQAKRGVELDYAGRIAQAKQLAIDNAKDLGQTVTDLQIAEAALPELEFVVSRLKELAPIATSTTAGKVWNAARKELGFKATAGATARARYQSLINNQILPLLRQTFGAAFTEKDREALEQTMGNVDLGPEEKVAALEEFIAAKRREIETQKRQLNIMGGQPVQESKIEQYRQRYQKMLEKNPAAARRFIEIAPPEILEQMGLSR